MAKRQVEWLKKKFIELKNLYGNKCAICKKEGDYLEFAHVKETELNGRGRGMWKRYYDIVNNLDSYRLMHKDCHEYYDSVLREDFDNMVF